MFHNCKRRSAGLPQTRRNEWLLDIAFRKRETFAYACEFYSLILQHPAASRARLEGNPATLQAARSVV